MAINKGTLAKKVNGVLEYVYPKTSADMVMFGNTNLGTAVEALQNNTVAPESGKGLSTNDFTNAYKNKLDSITVINNTADADKHVAEADLANEVAWDNVTNKPSDFTPSSHTHTISDISDIANAHVAEADSTPWSGITNKPNDFTPSAHNHTISEITDIANAHVAEADSVAWNGIANKPSTFTPSTHTHTISEISDIADAHVAEADSADSVDWSDVQNKPSDFTPSSHTHTEADISGNISASKITGVLSIDNIPQAAVAKLKTVADDTARFALTTNDVQNGDTVKVTATSKMYYVKDETNLDSESGYEVYAANATWESVSGKPSTFTPSTHNHTISEITDIANAHVAEADSVAWNGIQNKPSEFAPSAHTHDIADITDISTAHVAEADSADSVEWTDVQNKPSTFTPSTHNHTISEITDIANAHVSEADTVNGHSVNSDVPANAEFTDTVYTHPTHTAQSSGFYKVTVDALGHVTAVNAVTKTDITALGIPAQDTKYAGDGSTVVLNGTTFGLKSGVITAGSKGPTANVTGNNGATIKIPKITVDQYGRVTGLTEYTYTSVDNGYSPTRVRYTIAASGWVDNGDGSSTYTLPYSNSEYIVNVYFSNPTMTLAQYNMFVNAIIIGSDSANTLTSLGVKPSIDMPVLLELIPISAS